MQCKNALRADNQQATDEISNEYLAGFVDGEGCFYIGFGKRDDLPLKWQVITEFHLSQNPGGKNILETFKTRLDCGYIKPNHRNNPRDKSWVLIIKNRNDLRSKLIPFFDTHPLHSSKQQEYLAFKKVLHHIEHGDHLNMKGLEQIARDVYALNKNTNKRYTLEQIIS